MKYSTYALAFALLSTTPALAEDGSLIVQHQGNIPYVSGGVGREESDALEAAQRDYNLRITSADHRGHFYGNTHVIVRDAKAQTVLDLTGGPLFYAQMPKGRYVVEGSTEDGQTKTQKVNVSGTKPAIVHFSWSEKSMDITDQ
jgi:hypothetical protein